MKWSKEKPTEPGWYWVDHPPIAWLIVQVDYVNCELCVLGQGLQFWPLREYRSARWSGPIEPPEESS